MVIRKKHLDSIVVPAVAAPPPLEIEDKSIKPSEASTSIMTCFKGLHNYSQREIARRLKYPRSYVRRLEQTDWRKVTLGDFFELTKVFESSPEKVIARLQGLANGQALFTRATLNKLDRSKAASEKVYLHPLVEKKGGAILTVLYAETHVTFDTDLLRLQGACWFLVLEGTVTLELASSSYVLKEQEFFCLKQFIFCQFYNPSPMTRLCILFGVHETSALAD